MPSCRRKINSIMPYNRALKHECMCRKPERVAHCLRRTSVDCCLDEFTRVHKAARASSCKSVRALTTSIYKLTGLMFYSSLTSRARIHLTSMQWTISSGGGNNNIHTRTCHACVTKGKSCTCSKSLAMRETRLRVLTVHDAATIMTSSGMV
jgi:hypothetical protein